MEINEVQSRMEPVIRDGEVQIRVRVSVDGRIEDTTSPLEMTPETLDSLERRLAQTVRNDIEAALSTAQGFNSDIFGFGQSIYRRMPKEWRQIEDQWDELFTRLVVNIEVDANIRRSGLINDSLRFR